MTLRRIANSKRILNELRELTNECSDEYTAGPDGDDIHIWNASIIGPPNSPYEDGVFFLSITFPDDYPLKPPAVRFCTPIYHPNVTGHGSIGLPCLGCQWPICYTISKVLVSIRALLYKPDLDSIVEPLVAQVFRNQPEVFKKTAREWTNLYAI